MKKLEFNKTLKMIQIGKPKLTEKENTIKDLKSSL